MIVIYEEDGLSWIGSRAGGGAPSASLTALAGLASAGAGSRITQKVSLRQVAPPLAVSRTSPGRWSELPSEMAGAWMTTPARLLVNPRSAQPAPPSSLVPTVVQVAAPSPERTSQLAAEAVASTMASGVPAMVNGSPRFGGVPAFAQCAPRSPLTYVDLSMW